MLHSLGPETEKTRLGLLNFTFERCTAGSPRMDDRSPLELEALHSVTMDAGEIPEWMFMIRKEGDF